MKDIDRLQLTQLVEKQIDDSLALEEFDQLQRMLTDQPETRELYLDLMYQNANLHLERVHLSATVTPLVGKEPADETSGRRSVFRSGFVLAGVTSLLLLACYQVFQERNQRKSFEELVRKVNEPLLEPSSEAIRQRLKEIEVVYGQESWEWNSVKWQLPSALAAEDRFEEAIAAALDGEEPQWHIAAGLALQHQGPDKAIAICIRASSAGAGDETAWALPGVIREYTKKQELDKAYEAIRFSRQLDWSENFDIDDNGTTAEFSIREAVLSDLHDLVRAGTDIANVRTELLQEVAYYKDRGASVPPLVYSTIAQTYVDDRESIEWQQKAVDAYSQFSQFSRQNYVGDLVTLAQKQLWHGEHESAGNNAYFAVALNRSLGGTDTAIHAIGLSVLATVDVKRENFESAVEHSQLASKIFGQDKSESGRQLRFWPLYELAYSQMRLGNLEAAEETGLEARELAMQFDRVKNQAAALLLLADVARHNKQWQLARERSESALAMNALDPRGQWVAEYLLGYSYLAEGMPEQAESHVKAALAVAEGIDNAKVQFNLSRLYADLPGYESTAESYANSSIPILEEKLPGFERRHEVAIAQAPRFFLPRI